MLYEFAVLPDALAIDDLQAEPQTQTALIEFFRKLEKIGLLADPEGGLWGAVIEETLLPIESVESGREAARLRDFKGYLMACLEVLDNRNRIVRDAPLGAVVPSTIDDWFQIIALLDRQQKGSASRRFHQILLGKNSEILADMGDARLTNPAKVLHSKLWRGTRESVTVPMSPEEYRKLLNPVLRYAESLTIIDPFMSPCHDRNQGLTRFMATLDRCTDLLGRGLARQRGRIRVHAELPEIFSKSNRVGQQRFKVEEARLWSDHLQQIRLKYPRAQHRFEVYLWSLDNYGFEMHDRFIVSSQCAIGIQGGLESRNRPTKESTWAILEQDQVDNLLRKYDPLGHPTGIDGPEVIGKDQYPFFPKTLREES